MKIQLLLGAALLCGALAFAQSDDPVVMRINGKAVPRSEFEYSYNKNNTEGVIDKKSVADYVPLFVNYKLKVEAAKDAHLDTLKSYQNEFAGYRDQQIRPAMIDSTDIEKEARKIYTQTQQQVDSTGGMVHVAHILIRMGQRAGKEEQAAAKVRIDSIYDALKKGADFAELAKKCSQDPGSARNGGDLPWIIKGQTLKEFEDTAWTLKDGQVSRPFTTAAGWHIVMKKGAQKFYSYENQRPAIMRFIDQRGLKEMIINAKLDTLAKERHTTPAKLLEEKKTELEAKDPNLKYLIQEYHDGLLLYEISNRTVWDKAQKDTLGQENFFKKHRKNYKWERPRFKGMAYCTRDAADVQRVKDTVKGLAFDKWADKLRTTFNNDSVLRIRVEKGIFKQGDNALVDKEVFGVDTVPKPIKDYPYTAVYGKKLSKPESLDDVRALVVADYQDALEKKWVEELRRKYKVEVDESVLQTVNKH